MTNQTGGDLLPTNSTSPTSGDEDDDSIAATHAGAKRRIAHLEDQLSSLKEAVTKRKCDVVSNITQGRAICRLVSMFESVDDLVEENDRRLSLEEGDDASESPIPFTLQENRTFRGYAYLLKHIPPMRKNLLNLEFFELQLYFRELRKGSNGARGDDAANLKPVVTNWMATLFENPQPSTMLAPTAKSGRGFEHEDTGRLICPIDYNWEDPSVRKNIRDGHPEFVITADSWPAFLYPHARIHDDGNVEHGLFRSAILLKAFKFIFTSPTSAQDIDSEKDVDDQAPPLKKHSKQQKAPTRGNIANILGMKSVNPRSIAYVAVQLRFSLSNAGSWSLNDGCFSYPTFYNNIVDYFEDIPGPTALAEVNKLLSWWTSKIFGGHPSFSQLGQPRSGASVSKLAMQRAARELPP